jgi:hypothetical protein
VNVDERVQQLLAGVSIEDILRGREVEEAARILGDAVPTTYRRVSSGELGHIKIEGRARKGKGRAGSVRIRLLDIVTFQVRNEVAPGASTKPAVRR